MFARPQKTPALQASTYLAVHGGSILLTVDEILKCDHSNETAFQKYLPVVPSVIVLPKVEPNISVFK